jgi:hypothetical protein
MSQAIFGLIGVVIGGLISDGATYLMARRGERRRAQAAVRLVEAEVRNAATVAESVLPVILDDTPYPPRLLEQAWESLSALPTPSAWQAYKGDLAELLDARNWYAIADSYEALDALRRLDRHEITVPDGRLMHTAVAEALREINEDLKRGVAACASVAQVTPDQRPRSALRSYLVARSTSAPQQPTVDPPQ